MRLRPTDHPDLRYRSKIAKIHAIQWTGDNSEEVEKFTSVRQTFEHSSEDQVPCFQHDPSTGAGFVWNGSNHTWHRVNVGDFIIRGTRGQYYPCDPSAFHEAYTPVRGSWRAGATRGGSHPFSTRGRRLRGLPRRPDAGRAGRGRAGAR